MLLSPCVDMIFVAEYPDICDRIRAAKECGCYGVEFHLWRGKPIDAIAAALQETGLKLTSFCVDPRRSLVDPAEHDAFLAAVSETLPIAQRLGSAPIIVASGFNRPDMPRADLCRLAAEVLREAARRAAAAGITILLEPINTVIDHPGMFLDSAAEGLSIIEQAGADNLRLLYDLYHCTVMGEDMETALTGRMDLVGHIHFADVPGRHEPGTGAIDWRRTLDALDRLGYSGPIGLEYRPTLPGADSLALVRTTLGL